MKIFLDVGAYKGDTLKIAVKEGYDMIHCFEPSKKHWKTLFKIADSHPNQNIRINRFGLYDEFYQGLPLYGSGSDGASVFKEKPFEGKFKREWCTFNKTADWFKSNIYKDDEVHMKINVEGAELEILESLFDSLEILKVAELLVHYDCEKVPGKRGLSKYMENTFNSRGVLPNRLCVAPPRATVIHGETGMGGPKVNERWIRMINQVFC